MAPKNKEQFDVERHRYGGFVIYEVTGDELDSIESESVSVGEDFTVLVAGVSVGLSFLISIMSTEIASERTFSIFFIIMLLGFISSAYCGYRWYRLKKSSKSTIQKVKARVTKLGEQGDEINADELAEMSSVDPDDGQAQ